MDLRLYRLAPALALSAMTALAAAQKPAPTPRVSFRGVVEPLLTIECSGCHGKDNPSAKFSVASPEALRKGGTKFGTRIIVPGKPEQSALIGYLTGKHAPQMPLGKPALSAKQIALVSAWIAQGATVEPLQLSWPYTAPTKPTPPRIKDTAWCRNPIDAFVAARRETKGLTPAPAADKTTLLRRLSLDLIGLPPTPAEVDGFLADTRPDAYERIVDRLLADPRYGERWARHWLDLVRYAETHGFEADNIRPRAWRYRDYVIRSLNADKPYDRFLQEQLAGDELWPDDPEARIATGFLRLGAWDELSRDEPGRWQDFLNDATDTVGSAMLGMTIGCARCHDHKYDRITQRDYYRLQAFLTSLRWSDQPLPANPDSPTLTARRNTLQQELTTTRTTLDELRQTLRTQSGQPSADDGKLEQWLDTPGHRAEKERWHQLRQRLDSLQNQLRPIELVAEGITDKNNAPPTHHVLLRGVLATPGEKVTPGFVASLCGGQEQDAAIAPPATGTTSGARTALARWIASPNNPLTARVIVNRLWQHHFGRGLVATPSDFGKNGGKPSHPELLDWLAQDLIAQGWSLKALHRRIVTSATYRQAVASNPKAQKLDPANTLLWRQNRQRLEGEAIRDSILAVSGGLNPEAFGPSVYPRVSGEVLDTGSTHKWGSSPDDQQRRRTIYVFQRRSLALPLTEVFDGPDMVNTCPRRATTTIAPQALALFNGTFPWDEARRCADRVEKEAGSERDAQLTWVYRLALSRRPTPTELQAARGFIVEKTALHRRENDPRPEHAALVDFCHILFNTNEFLYTD